jgi:hypothetical protein
MQQMMQQLLARMEPWEKKIDAETKAIQAKTEATRAEMKAIQAKRKPCETRGWKLRTSAQKEGAVAVVGE